MDQENRSGTLFVAGRLAGAQSLPLLATKAYRSPISPNLIQHTRLTEHLMHNRHQPLALTSDRGLGGADLGAVPTKL